LDQIWKWLFSLIIRRLGLLKMIGNREIFQTPTLNIACITWLSLSSIITCDRLADLVQLGEKIGEH
jgi:hypothetical protein